MHSAPADHILTFDIEDWFHILGVPALEAAASWCGRPSIVERETDAILEQLEAHGARATFFVVGWIAERYPALVARIAECGHEVGSHSHWHRPVNTLSAAAFREDLRRSMGAIEDAAGARVTGYRAPSFSITPGTEWAFDALTAAGLTYDASLFPVPRSNGGYPCSPGPHRRTAPSGRPFAETPMTALRLGPVRAAVSGGGYFRLAPLSVIEAALRQSATVGAPSMIYLHPRDFTRDWPLEALPPRKRLAAWIGCAGARRKLDRLLARWRFAGCRDYLAAGGLLT